jgi:hypothetical protein
LTTTTRRRLDTSLRFFENDVARARLAVQKKPLTHLGSRRSLRAITGESNDIFRHFSSDKNPGTRRKAIWLKQ